MKKAAILFVFLMIPFSVQTAPPDFRSYWYQGKAELTRYSLEQARYGEIHKGESVLIFVTEPFLTEKQVKKESASSNPATSVLKLNLTKKFFTGIYPYSLMTSVFSPVDYQKFKTLKVSSSTQEWCGHTYSQLNLRNDGYQATVYSYFENEGDQNLKLKNAWLEDEIWTRIRIAPETLPSGDFELIPSLQFVRLGHVPVKVEVATAQRKKEGKFDVYTIQYKNLKRSLSVRFESAFPYAIHSWEENTVGGFGSDAPMLTTKAVKTNSLMLDYWNRHGVEDAHFREKLGLTQR